LPPSASRCPPDLPWSRLLAFNLLGPARVTQIPSSSLGLDAGLDDEAVDADEADPGPSPLAADPTAAGDHDVQRERFDVGYALLDDPTNGPAPGQTYPARLNGTVHLPEDGEGPFPLVLVLHGRHTTCRLGPQGAAELGPPRPGAQGA
jgi:hypothetical protein